MTYETDILIAVQEAVRKALATSANEEIEKQKHKFECEMGKLKNALIGKLLNEIEICAKHDLPDDRYAIQIVIRKG